MKLRCLLGFHKLLNNYVEFSEPIKSGKFNNDRSVRFIRLCEYCDYKKITNTYIYTEQNFNVLLSNQISEATNKRIETLILNSNLTLDEIAKEVGVSISTVRRRFKQFCE